MLRVSVVKKPDSEWVLLCFPLLLEPASLARIPAHPLLLGGGWGFQVEAVPLFAQPRVGKAFLFVVGEFFPVLDKGFVPRGLLCLEQELALFRDRPP